MKSVRHSDIIREMANSGRRNIKFPENVLDFIMRRYFHYALEGLVNGFEINGCIGFYIKPGMIFFSEIRPKTLLKNLRISDRVFGYVFMPVCSNKIIEKYGYNYRPARIPLKLMKDFSETDDIYKLLSNEKS